MTYKTFVPRQICILVSLAVILDLARIAIFGTSSLDYLLWNIFLAALPFVVSATIVYYQDRKKLTRIFLTVGAIVWLLLLPNAPYMITDLVHIGSGHASQLFYDIVLFFSCALAGLSIGLYSLSHMQYVFEVRYGKQTARALLLLSMLLTSFGVAIGRFLRFNSWDIFTNTGMLFHTIGNIFSAPQVYIHIYMTTGVFFLFIYMAYNAWDFKTHIK